MAHVVWKHMGMRMNYMGIRMSYVGIRMSYAETRMSGATISMVEWAAPRRGASMQALLCKA